MSISHQISLYANEADWLHSHQHLTFLGLEALSPQPHLPQRPLLPDGEHYLATILLLSLFTHTLIL